MIPCQASVEKFIHLSAICQQEKEGIVKMTSVQQHPASVDMYIRHGWHLVPIPPGTKGPRHRNWNHKQNCLKSHNDLPTGWGIGLAHAYSGTMALDVDHWHRATVELAKYDIDLHELYHAVDAVVVDSGRDGHGKLLYAMPFGLVLPSKKLIDYRAEDDTRYNYLDFRCATVNGLTVQDILPPSIHPDTSRPYQWSGRGHWSRLPIIPMPLLDMWHELLRDDDQRNIESVDSSTSWTEIRSALEAISPDISRDEWVKIGMALHHAGHQTDQVEQALYLFNEWSSQSETKYKGERDILNCWRSFKPGNGITLGTLFHIAIQYGWSRPQPSAESLFQPINPDAPLKIVENLRPPPPELDLNIFPEILATRAREVSEQVGCDPIVPLFAGLAAICGAIDAESRLELMHGFQVPPVLWLMTIGAPADKKSPGSRPMMGILKDLEREDIPRYKKELLQWEGFEAAYASAKKSFLEFAASAENMLGETPPDVPDLPPRPVSLKITVSDITSQKLIRQAADRPRGLLCYLDEMNSWIRKMIDKASIDDRSAWVSSYEAERYEMDRVGAGSIHCNNLAVSIYGNVQPAVFRASLELLSRDGLIQRFIPAVLNGHKTRLGNPVPDCMTHKDQWEQVIRICHALPAQTYRLSERAYDHYRDFQKWYEDMKVSERVLDSADVFMTAFGKLEGLTGRMALIFHVIENPFSPEVSYTTMKRAVHFTRSYLIPAYRYTFGEIGGIVDKSLDSWMVDKIIQISEDTKTITMQELRRAARRRISDKPQWQQEMMVMDAMEPLESANWVARTENEPLKHHVRWAINPSLGQMYQDHRNTVKQAKDKLMREVLRYKKPFSLDDDNE